MCTNVLVLVTREIERKTFAQSSASVVAGGATARPLNFSLSFFSGIQYFGLKIPHFGEFTGKIENFQHAYLLCRKFATSCTPPTILTYLFCAQYNVIVECGGIGTIKLGDLVEMFCFALRVMTA